MFESTIFHYLDERDTREFEDLWGTDDQSLLVSGSKTAYRLKKYLSEREWQNIRIILTVLVRDFELPSVRYTYAIAIVIYTVSLEKNSNSIKENKDIAEAELALLLEHLMTDSNDRVESEKSLFDINVEMVMKRWNEYLSNPSKFVL